MDTPKLQKLTIVGNAGTGKTTLSKKLSKMYGLPLTHVDSIQFLEGLKIRPYKESIEILNKVIAQEKWLIEGYGPLDILEKRFQTSDRIVFIDLPLWRSYLWCTKRQIKNLWAPREELPQGSKEATLEHTLKLYKTLWQVHTKMRPELLRIFARDNLKSKMIFIRSVKEWNKIFYSGIEF